MRPTVLHLRTASGNNRCGYKSQTLHLSTVSRSEVTCVSCLCQMRRATAKLADEYELVNAVREFLGKDRLPDNQHHTKHYRRRIKESV